MLGDVDLSFGDDIVLVDGAVGVEDAGGVDVEDDDADGEGVDDAGLLNAGECEVNSFADYRVLILFYSNRLFVAGLQRHPLQK